MSWVWSFLSVASTIGLWEGLGWLSRVHRGVKRVEVPRQKKERA